MVMLKRQIAVSIENKTEMKRVVKFFTDSYIFTKVDKEKRGDSTVKFKYPKYRLFNKEDLEEVKFNIPSKNIAFFAHTVVSMLNAPDSVITDDAIQKPYYLIHLDFKQNLYIQ